jgi:hypothetical protein
MIAQFYTSKKGPDSVAILNEARKEAKELQTLLLDEIKANIGKGCQSSMNFLAYLMS